MIHSILADKATRLVLGGMFGATLFRRPGVRVIGPTGMT